MKEMTELNPKTLLDESNEKPNLNETSDATDAAIDNSVSAKDANKVTDGALLSVKEKCPDEDEGNNQPFGVCMEFCSRCLLIKVEKVKILKYCRKEKES